jgi:DNA helicase-2/ATP-dependent DNA helicase PcrA
MKRLQAIYEVVFIDEMQDLAGYDLEVVERLLKSHIQVTMVGDPRQTTYATNASAKNRQFRGLGILRKADEWESKGLCRVARHSKSYRSNQAICDYADQLWPDMARSISHNHERTGHDGVFIVRQARIHEYVRAFKPVILRYDKRTDPHGYQTINYGNAKGRTFDRVLILPHGPIKEYLRTGSLARVRGSLSKFYVAITRARFSVGFVYDGEVPKTCRLWEPDSAGDA